ncbi:unnamed protein product [Rangifer tarandus platyrhynchus]|uniref:Uncharacterized protein n=1 Tax=Rangifer tarandus platyrhynchus TaxID=3082113 RepID=A0ABN8Y3N6_RANTA|nr:unnamed protein product [Rangifer tarandus platyrhynchus]
MPPSGSVNTPAPPAGKRTQHCSRGAQPGERQSPEALTCQEQSGSRKGRSSAARASWRRVVVGPPACAHARGHSPCVSEEDMRAALQGGGGGQWGPRGRRGRPAVTSQKGEAGGQEAPRKCQACGFGGSLHRRGCLLDAGPLGWAWEANSSGPTVSGSRLVSPLLMWKPYEAPGCADWPLTSVCRQMLPILSPVEPGVRPYQASMWPLWSLVTDIITSVLRACPHLHHPASPSTCHLHGARRPRRGNVTVMFKYSPTTVTSQPLGEPASSAVQERLEGTGQKP